MPTRTLICESIIEPLATFVAGAGVTDFMPDLPRRLQRPADPRDEPQVYGDEVVRLFEGLAARLKRPSFGLDYAESFPVGGTGAFGFILANSKDMRAAVNAIARYTQIVISGVEVRYQPVEAGAQLSWRYPVALTGPQAQFNSFVAALVVLRLRAGLSPDWSPKGVQLAHRDPGAPESYRRIFGPNVSFEQTLNCLTFRDAYLDRPNFAANPRLFEVVKRMGEILLASRKTGGDFRTTVSNRIVDLVGVSTPTLAAIAEALGLSGRTVQRRLAGEGTTFDAVLAETRRLVAERLLRDSDLALTDIAFMLGLSELSAFTRAAKRWHGIPPGQFRAKSRADAG